MLPGLTRDTFGTRRPAASGTDAEGNAAGGLTSVITSAQGTWGTPSFADTQAANERGDTVDAILATDSTLDIRIGDVMTVRGDDWTVVAVQDARFHNRIHLRTASGD